MRMTALEEYNQRRRQLKARRAKQAIKLAGEILAQPEFKLTRYPAHPYSPHRWCKAPRINAECHAKREAECRGDQVTCGCDLYKVPAK